MGNMPKIESDTPVLMMGGLSAGSEYLVLTNALGENENIHTAVRFNVGRQNQDIAVISGTVRYAYDSTYEDEGVVAAFKNEDELLACAEEAAVTWANVSEKRLSTYFAFAIPVPDNASKEESDAVVTTKLVSSILKALTEGLGVDMDDGYHDTMVNHLTDRFQTDIASTCFKAPEKYDPPTEVTGEIGGAVISLEDWKNSTKH